MSITYEAVLDVSEDSARFLSTLPRAERVRRGTRKGIRASGTDKQAVPVLRWFLDGTRMSPRHLQDSFKKPKNREPIVDQQAYCAVRYRSDHSHGYPA
jgi:hypothetical protein